MGKGRLERLGVEGSQPRPIPAAGSQHHHRRGPPAIRPPPHRGQFARDLVERQRQEIRELHESDGPPPRQRAADAHAHDRAFRQGGIRHAPREIPAQPAGQPEHVALRILDVLAVQGDPVVRRQLLAQDVAHRLQHGARMPVGRVANPRRRRGSGPRRAGVVIGRRVGRRQRRFHRRADGPIRLRRDGIQFRSRDPRDGKARGEDPDGIRSRARALQLGFPAVDPFVVGIGVVGEAFDGDDREQRSLAGADPTDEIAERPVAFPGIAPVEAFDRHAVELGGGTRRTIVERLGARVRGDGKAIVLDQEQDGQAGADGLGDGLEHLALLGGAIAHRAHDDGHGSRRSGTTASRHQFMGDADRLERVVAHGTHQTEDVEIRRAEVGAHLPAGGMRPRGAQETVKELNRGNAPGQHQGLVAVVEVQPVVRNQMRGQGRHRLVATAADVEKRLATIDEFHFDTVQMPGQLHPTQQLQRARQLGARDGWRGHVGQQRFGTDFAARIYDGSPFRNRAQALRHGESLADRAPSTPARALAKINGHPLPGTHPRPMAWSRQRRPRTATRAGGHARDVPPTPSGPNGRSTAPATTRFPRRRRSR